jgi:1,4-alpha-glucan branching enzyme
MRVHVVAPAPQLPKGDMHWVNARRVSVHRVQPQFDFGKVPFDPFLEKALELYARITSRQGFSQHEALVVHGQHWAGVFVAMHLKHRFGVPIVATLHKTPIGEAHGETVKDTYPSYCHFTWLSSWPIDVFVAGSGFFATELKKQAPNARVEVIPHGVPARWLRDRASVSARCAAWEKLGLNADDELILCPVRWDRRKRIPDFIAAAGKVLAELPERRFKLLITADVGGTDRDKLIKNAQEEGILGSLVLQTLSFEEVPAIFRAARLVVVPTDREGLGISVLEAMALKTPVVATAADGILEIISHEKNGYLYAAGNVNQLAQIIVKLLREKTCSSALVVQGHATVTTAFSDTIMTRRHEEVYRSLL